MTDYLVVPGWLNEDGPAVLRIEGETPTRFYASPIKGRTYLHNVHRGAPRRPYYNGLVYARFSAASDAEAIERAEPIMAIAAEINRTHIEMIDRHRAEVRSFDQASRARMDDARKVLDPIRYAKTDGDA